MRLLIIVMLTTFVSGCSTTNINIKVNGEKPKELGYKSLEYIKPTVKPKTVYLKPVTKPCSCGKKPKIKVPSKEELLNRRMAERTMMKYIKSYSDYIDRCNLIIKRCVIIKS